MRNPAQSAYLDQGFGWAKTIGQMRQVMVRGLKKVDQMFVLNMAAYNLVRCVRWDRCVCRAQDETERGAASTRTDRIEPQMRLEDVENETERLKPLRGRRGGAFQRQVFQQPANPRIASSPSD